MGSRESKKPLNDVPPTTAPQANGTTNARLTSNSANTNNNDKKHKLYQVNFN